MTVDKKILKNETMIKIIGLIMPILERSVNNSKGIWFCLDTVHFNTDQEIVERDTYKKDSIIISPSQLAYYNLSFPQIGCESIILHKYKPWFFPTEYHIYGVSSWHTTNFYDVNWERYLDKKVFAEKTYKKLIGLIETIFLENKYVDIE